MGEDFDMSIDAVTDGMDADIIPELPSSEDVDADTHISDGLYDNVPDVDFTPFDDTSVEAGLELTLPAQDLESLQLEADALAIEPLDEPSTLSEMAIAAISNADSPGLPAQLLGGSVVDPVSGEYAAQLAQMGIDAIPVAIEGMTENIIDTYGRSPSVGLNELQILQEIDADSSPLAEPLIDNQDYFDENGACITDESLRE